MKEKKNKGSRKVLLMAISVALVAAISVSSTLAYLSAKTKEKDNIFKASGGITGEVLEPSFDSEKTYYYNPGEDVAKDPLIQNTTTDASVYVGARLDFYIRVTGTDYVQVPYSVFEEYVKIGDLNTGTDTTNWTDITTAATNNTTGSKYYLYNSTIGKADTNVPSADNSYAGTDNTQPIFKKVTPDPAIRIESLTDTSKYTTTIDAPGADKVYEKFDFKIKITGYGVKDDASISGSNDNEKLASATTLILKGLGGLTA